MYWSNSMYFVIERNQIKKKRTSLQSRGLRREFFFILFDFRYTHVKETQSSECYVQHITMDERFTILLLRM